MAITIYLHPLSSYSQKVKMALYENDTPFETKMLDGSEPVASEFAALWPIGRFPVLTDGGRMVTEATIIIEYLDMHYPGATRLVPADPDVALEARMMDRFFDNYLQGPQQRIVAIALGRDKAEPEPLRAQLETAYEVLERLLEGRTWAAGDIFSLADCRRRSRPPLCRLDPAHPQAFAPCVGVSRSAAGAAELCPGAG